MSTQPFIIWRIAATLACCLVLSWQCAAESQARPARVLIVTSFMQGVPWTQRFMHSLETSILSANRDIELQIDYMHTKRFKPDERYFAERRAFYLTEFARVEFGVIVAVGPDALDFLLRYGDELFPQTPVVFAGVDPVRAEAANRRAHYNGTAEPLNISRTIELARRLFPKTRRLVLTHDQTSAGLAAATAFMTVENDFPDIEFLYLTDKVFPDVLAEVRGLPSESVVMPLAFNVDRSGNFHVGSQAQRAIIAASPVPTLGIWEYQIQDGVLGGAMVDETQYAGVVGRAVMRILADESIKSVDLSMDSSIHNLFDYSELRRFDVPYSVLPRGSRIVNQPHSIWQDHRVEVVSALSAFGLLTGVILMMGVNIARRRKAEAALVDSITKYELLFEGSPDVIFLLRDNRFVVVNTAITEILGYSTDEVVNVTPWDISPEYQPDGTPSKDKAAQYIDLALRNGAQTFEWTHRRKDGSDVSCEVNLVAYEVSEQLYVQAIVRDITERKQIEETQKRLEQQMNEKIRHFYREVILSVTNGKLLICDDSEVERLLSSADLVMPVSDNSDIPGVRHKLEDHYSSLGLDREWVLSFITAVGEAVNNAVKHAPEGRVYAGTGEDRIWVGVVDNGPGIDSIILPSAALRRGFSTQLSMGLGYSVMLELSDRVLLKTRPEGTTVVLEKLLVQPLQTSLEQMPDTWDSV